MILLHVAYAFGALICILIAWVFLEFFKEYVKEMFDPAMIREPHDYLILAFLAGCSTALVICAGTLIMNIKS